ncbi:hypothetical protein GGR20_001394 [Devosia subaequoris]|uniref:DUF998 domain-containing protein n=1 Tax=Devosia subaequoris TaxID=395930 RepID=A0A7W6ILC7_9HYPH|nr:DUF998 domain-containing protein [Devosia subaequoris]MBB4051752.1 hypothetical protein [Devosia subaequoris]MCP1210911.1 DUF998 domain-containing protein [Devosia subaequoris]
MTAAHRSHLATICGYLGLLGCGAVVFADLVGIIVFEKHNPFSETISALAHGQYGWIQDVGLYALAVAIVAIAVALPEVTVDDGQTRTARALLISLALAILAIAGVNQDLLVTSPASTLHLLCVLILYTTVAVASALLWKPLQARGWHWGRLGLGFAIAWTVLAPIFFFVPTAWDGAYERLLGAMLLGWLGSLAWLLVQKR